MTSNCTPARQGVLRARLAHLRSAGAQDGTSTVEFALLLPVIVVLIGIAGFALMGVLQGALLDRAAEIMAREISIDGDVTRALVEAQDSTPMITLITAVTRDADGAPLEGRPTAGQEFTVEISSTSANPTAPMTALLLDGEATGTTLTLTRSARGLGQ